MLSLALPSASAEEDDDDDAAAQRTVRVGTQGTARWDEIEKAATPRTCTSNMPAAIRSNAAEEVAISALQLSNE